jgi:hypothetical protein
MWSWVILLAISIILAMVLYRSTHRTMLSALLAALVAASALQLAVRIELGYLDEFWPIAATVSFAVAFCVSLIFVLVWRGVELSRKP